MKNFTLKLSLFAFICTCILILSLMAATHRWIPAEKEMPEKKEMPEQHQQRYNLINSSQP